MVRHVAPAAGRSAARAVEGDDAGRLRVLHVVMSAGPTNSQWNEHCLPNADERLISVCSLLPATVPDDPRIQRVEGDGTVLGCLRALDRALRLDVDVVHVHSPVAATVMLAVSLFRLRRLDDVVLTVHNSWPPPKLRNRVLGAVSVLLVPTVVACSASAAASLPRSLRRLRRAGLHVVPNGVDTARLDEIVRRAASGRNGRDRRSLHYVSVGRLIDIKDPVTVVRAFAAAAGPTDRLTMVGEGPLREAVLDTATDLGITERLTLTGLVERNDVYRMLATADVYVSASHNEGLPVAVLEAMAAGLPLVLTDIQPHRELGLHGDFLARPGDAASLASALRSLASMSSDARRAVGEAHRARVVEQFSVRAMKVGYDAVYAEVTARHGSALRDVAAPS